jgi:DNA invertase Pin-like site-specific DNA recombinase
VGHLQELVAHLSGQLPLAPYAANGLLLEQRPYPDLSEVQGQVAAKRALLVAAAGAHNLLRLCNNAPTPQRASPMKPKAYSYIRFSSPEQAKGDSYRRQRAAALKYCAENGLELADTKEYRFFDSGRSAYTGKHVSDEGEFGRFLSLVKEDRIKPGSFLLVESLDRLSRDKVNIALGQLLNLLGTGIKVVTLSDKRTYSNDSPDLATELIVSIAVMMRAHNESSEKGSRVAEAWRKKRELARSDKTPNGAACPYWLKLVDGAHQPVQERVDVIRRIFDMTIAGYGQTAISRKLNEDGIPVFGSTRSTREKPRNKSGLWGTSSVQKILQNRALLGEYQPTHLIGRVRQNDGDPIQGYYPEVITQDVFLQAKAARAQRQTSGSTKQSRNFNIWQGIAKCQLCGDAMHLINKGRPPKGYTYLQCYSTKKGKCGNGSIRIEQTEAVFKEILTNVDSMSLIHGRSAEVRKTLEVEEGKLALIASKLEQAIEAHTAYPSLRGAKLLRDLEEEHNQTLAARDDLRGQLASHRVINKDDYFEQLDLVTYERRAAANGLLKRLGIQVQLKRDNPSRFQCRVLDKSDEATTDEIQQILFGVLYEDGKVTTQALDPDIFNRQVEQGVISSIAAIREQEEDGVGWQWLSGKLTR